MFGLGVAALSEDAGVTALFALTVGHLNCRSCYHYSIERFEDVFRSGLGFAERRSNSGHCASLTTFSAIEPKISGCQPEIPCVEITTMSICSRSATSIMLPAISLPTSMLEIALPPLEERDA